MSVLVLGTIALDTVETERGRAVECLGGSGVHAACALSYFTRPRIVGVVGEDFPENDWEFLAARADVSEVRVLPGKTFRWHAEHDLRTGATVAKLIQLNTYSDFDPVLSPASAASPYVVLGNISPALQRKVMEQLQAPKVITADTMPHWIEMDPEGVRWVMRHCDVFFLNADEAELLTGNRDARQAGRVLLQQGAQRVIIKQGREPAVLVARDGTREVPAYPGADLVDPTGAGDNFAGATVGRLAERRATADDLDALADAMSYGAATASFVIEAFGIEAHRRLTREQIEARRATLLSAGSGRTDRA